MMGTGRSIGMVGIILGTCKRSAMVLMNAISQAGSIFQVVIFYTGDITRYRGVGSAARKSGDSY